MAEERYTHLHFINVLLSVDEKQKKNFKIKGVIQLYKNKRANAGIVFHRSVSLDRSFFYIFFFLEFSSRHSEPRKFGCVMSMRTSDVIFIFNFFYYHQVKVLICLVFNLLPVRIKNNKLTTELLKFQYASNCFNIDPIKQIKSLTRGIFQQKNV